jgi:predicted ester cyclase
VNTFRLANGRIAERWGTMEAMGLMQQLGVASVSDEELLDVRKGWYWWAWAGWTGRKIHRRRSPVTLEEANLGHRSHKEWVEGHNPAIVDEIYAPDCVMYAKHIPRAQKFGREGFKAYGASLYAAFPDLKINHDMVVTEEDGQYQMVYWSFTGTHLGPMGPIAATGRKVTLQGLDVFRVANGQIQELYLGMDAMSLMQQLGVIPG